ncbi:uncharacterized protein A4U43_C08F27060 [Asparagus officinalis]|nr:uncharacterized protein A4U43_C08F27060 [Asparagus officinalis]
MIGLAEGLAVDGAVEIQRLGAARMARPGRGTVKDLQLARAASVRRRELRAVELEERREELVVLWWLRERKREGLVQALGNGEQREENAQMRSKQTQKVDDSGVEGVVVEGKGEQGVIGEDIDVDAEEGVGRREAAARE